MRQILGIIILSLFCVNFSLAELVQSKVREKYKIDDKILAITNNGFLDEVYLCNSSNENCKLINKHFSFIKLAQECESIQKKNIYFAVNKEHFFMGGINENAPLRIYDLEGNVHGSAPNLEYAQQFCKFY
tara:strand:- start:108 stop:497 length:390 start_codon:yes stop_codon:yes gene_type:complete